MSVHGSSGYLHSAAQKRLHIHAFASPRTSCFRSWRTGLRHHQGKLIQLAISVELTSNWLTKPATHIRDGSLLLTTRKNSSLVLKSQKYSTGGRAANAAKLLASSSGNAAPREEEEEEENLWRVHQELLKQLEERRKMQQELKTRMTRGAPQVSQNSATPPVTSRRAEASPNTIKNSSRDPSPSPSAAVASTASVSKQWRDTTQYSPVKAPATPEINPEQSRTSKEERGKVSAANGRQSLPEIETQQAKVHNENAMKVVLVGSECAPWSKTGGLGDVMNALPKALARRGHRVMAVAPRYEAYAEGWETGTRRKIKVYGQDHEIGYFHGFMDGVDYVFVDHPSFHGFANNIYGGNRQDLAFRCALLCKGALEAVWHVPCGGCAYGDDNLVFVANDWHTGLLPVYLQAHYRDYNQMTYARSVFVIHNIAHQGRAPMTELGPLEIPDNYVESFRLYDPIGGEHMNIMKAGFEHAHRIVAVSHGYAWECQTQEGGWGLDAVLRDNSWKLRGIVNGMDYKEWSPEHDSCLTSDGYRRYTVDTLKEGKAACKAALQRELGLPVDPSIPMLGFIGRLDYQKGVDLICESFEWLMDQGVQLIMLGSGRDDLESALRGMESSRHNQCRGWVGFSVTMSHRITAGCDILLMPSRFEPCGLNQLYAMAYGTVPVVHAVGGLRDTVQPFNPHENTGTGWTYEWSSGENLREALWNAIYTFRDHKSTFLDIARRGMRQDLSWDNAAQQYEEVMLAAKYQW